MYDQTRNALGSCTPDYRGVPLDIKTIPQDRLNIDNKERSNPFPWSGQFSPQLVEELLRTYSHAGSLILDPFAGSGTVVHEAGRLGLQAFGSEINPAAFKLAAVYGLINVNLAKRRRVLECASSFLDQFAPISMPLFQSSSPVPDRPLPAALTGELEAVRDPHAKKLLEALIVLLNFGEREIDSRLVESTWGKVRDVASSLPFSEAPIVVENCDARTLPLASERVELVLTSPPYINVFNYHQQYRKSAELMGWNLLEVARSEIGSNRKHRGNRFLTVVQYCLDVADVFRELRRVCKEGARIIFVVGRESRVRKTPFFNGEIVAGLAVRCAGLELRSRQERVFQNRFGERIFEDVLHFEPRPLADVPTSPPLEVAREALAGALARAPAESVADLRDALDRAPDVDPSPLYRPRGDEVWAPRVECSHVGSLEPSRDKHARSPGPFLEQVRDPSGAGVSARVAAARSRV